MVVRSLEELLKIPILEWHALVMLGSDWGRERELPVRLPSGQCIRLGDLTGEMLLQIVLEAQTAPVREVLAAIVWGYRNAHDSER